MSYRAEPSGGIETSPAREIRSCPPGQLRVSRRANGQPVIEGLAIVYESWSVDLGGFREIIRRGAAARVIRERQDVRCLGHHDVGFVMGRTKPGTLTLREDSEGLHFECMPSPKSPRAMELVESLDRGDIDSCSFAFDTPPGGVRWLDTNLYGLAEREITDLIVYEVSIVAFPAYTSTSAAARSLEIERRNRSLQTTVNVPFDPLSLRLRLAFDRAARS